MYAKNNSCEVSREFSCEVPCEVGGKSPAKYRKNIHNTVYTCSAVKTKATYLRDSHANTSFLKSGDRGTRTRDLTDVNRAL